MDEITSFGQRVDAVLGSLFQLAEACMKERMFEDANNALQAAGNLVLASNSQDMMMASGMRENDRDERDDPLADLDE